MRAGWLVSLLAAALAVAVACGVFAGEYAVRSFGAGGFAVTNAQANNVWQP